MSYVKDDLGYMKDGLGCAKDDLGYVKDGLGYAKPKSRFMKESRELFNDVMQKCFLFLLLKVTDIIILVAKGD